MDGWGVGTIGTTFFKILKSGASLPDTSMFKYSGLSTNIVSLTTFGDYNFPEADEYENIAVNSSFFVFYSGAETGDFENSSFTLATTLAFAVAESAWGIIEQIVFDSHEPGPPQFQCVIAGRLTPPPDIVIGDQIVFLGSPVWGAGDIRIKYNYQ